MSYYKWLWTVRFTTMTGLEHCLMGSAQQNLVIVDELGYIPFSRRSAELLFQFFSSRYERGSMIITTNLEFPEWNQVFGDEKMTAALLDRITHNAHILITNGESYRLKQTLKRRHESNSE